MRTTPRFVTPVDFLNYTGIDLNLELKEQSNDSNKANLFLLQIEDKLLARVDATSFRLTSWENISDYQKECLQKAIILQAEYILRNSDIFSDSGYDPEKGIIADYSKLQTIAICPSSTDLLQSCGLLNHVVKNRRRFLDLGLNNR